MSDKNTTLVAESGATAISDTTAKGKEREADASPQVSDEHPSTEDIWGQYPFESFPSPPADTKDDDPTPPAVQNTDTSLKFNPPLNPPLMALTYPPSPPLADDPKWYAKMFSEVHRHREHLNGQLEIARREAVAALGQVTLAQIELSAEMDNMQDFLDRVASVAGKSFVRKLLSSVQYVMENGEDAADESEGDRQDVDADAEDSSDDDDGNDNDDGKEEKTVAKKDNQSNNGDESEGDDPASSDHGSCDADAESQGGSKDGSRPPEEVEEASTYILPQKDQKNAEDRITGDEDEKSLRSSQDSPSRKRLREEDEDEEGSPNNSPRKKFKTESVFKSNFTSAQHAHSDDEGGPILQHVWSPEDDEVDPEPNSEEEYEVEDSLLLVGSEPDTPPLPGPSTGTPRSLLEVSRDPRRLRQNSRGEPELYIPIRR